VAHLQNILLYSALYKKTRFEGNIIQLKLLNTAYTEITFSKIMFIYAQSLLCFLLFIGAHVFKICIHKSENFLLHLTQD